MILRQNIAYEICSSDGFTNILTLHIYKFECFICILRTYVRINTRFHEKNRETIRRVNHEFIFLFFIYRLWLLRIRMTLSKIGSWLTDWRITWPNLNRALWIRPSHQFEVGVNEVERRGLLNLLIFFIKLDFDTVNSKE